MFHNVQIKKAVVNYFCFTATPRLVGLKPPYWIFCKFSNNLFLSYLVNSALHGNYVIILNTKTLLYTSLNPLILTRLVFNIAKTTSNLPYNFRHDFFGHKLYNLVKKRFLTIQLSILLIFSFLYIKVFF